MYFSVQGVSARISVKPIVLDASYGLMRFGDEFKLINGPKGNDLNLSVGLFVAVLVVFVAYWVVHRTRSGRTIYATGGSHRLPRRSSPASCC